MLLDAQHWIKRCQACQRVMEQCRCADPHKLVVWGICLDCLGKEMPCRFYGMA